MESGTFNHNKKILNLIIKYSKDTELSSLILKEMSSGNTKNYIKDIRRCGVKTASVLFEVKIKNKSIIIENYISGKTIDEILKTNSKEKLKVLRKLLQIYKRISMDENLCLDWNLKNFIYHGNELYYIDFVPCIYKDKLQKSNSHILKDYIDTYLDSNITLLGIYYYSLKTALDNLSKEELLLFSKKLKQLYQRELNIKLDFENDHPYSKCIKEINNYMNTNIDIEALKKQLKKCSLEEEINGNIKKKYAKHK